MTVPEVVVSPYVITLARMIFILFAGWMAFRVVVGFIARMGKKRLSAQAYMILNNIVWYATLIIMGVTLAQELGFNVSALLGAAGVAGIAIGFAAQTSVSNIISGLFLISEKPFVVDDIIRIGDIEGRVISIDSLSVKIRTYNNNYVRVPNENLIKNSLINVTRFPMRRFDFNVGVAYKEDMRRVIQALYDVIKNNEYSANDPEPRIMVNKFAESEIELSIGVWVEKKKWLALRSTLLIEIKEKFDVENIEIPFPQRVMYKV